MLGHHSQRRGNRKKGATTGIIASRTVNGNGDALRESEAILANKGGDLAETVGLEVLSGSVALLSLDDVELDVVRLGYSLDGSRAAVVLKERTSQ